MNLRHLACRVAQKTIYPLLPRRARLPFVYWLQWFAGDVEPELANAGSLCEARGIALDIGANIGLWSYRLEKIFSKVYAFEVNDDVTGDLIGLASPRVELIHMGLSSKPGKLTLYIPVSKGVQLNGWASLQPGNCPDTNEHVTKKVEVRTLDSFGLRDVSFMKMDVEGHELEVLHGARETLAASRPVVLLEVKEYNVEKVAAFFEELGYEEVKVGRATVLEGVAANHVFRPRPSRP